MSIKIYADVIHGGNAWIEVSEPDDPSIDNARITISNEDDSEIASLSLTYGERVELIEALQRITQP